MNISILLIDDNIEFTENVNDYLKMQNIHINKIITNEAGAIKEVRNKFYDIIIIDMNLDDNMYAGLEIIKNVKNLNAVGFIVVSGHRDVKITSDTLNYGILRYLNKPFDFDILHVHILDLIRLRNLALSGKNILSHKQKTILKAISQGIKAEKIADSLGLGLDVINYHKKIILGKLKVSTINEALIVAVKNELFT